LQLFDSLRQIKDSELVSKLEAEFNNKKISPDSFKKFGLITKLIEAEKNKNQEQYKTIRQSLIQAIHDESHLDKLEIQKLNAEGLVLLSQSISPIHTAENAAITWITSIGLGAVLTTILYSNLAPILMDSKMLNSPDFLYNAIKNCIEFTTAYYLVLGKKPWEIYHKAYDQMNEVYFKFLYKIPLSERSFLDILKETAVNNTRNLLTSSVQKNMNNYLIGSCNKLFN